MVESFAKHVLGNYHLLKSFCSEHLLVKSVATRGGNSFRVTNTGLSGGCKLVWIIKLAYIHLTYNIFIPIRYNIALNLGLLALFCLCNSHCTLFNFPRVDLAVRFFFCLLFPCFGSPASDHRLGTPALAATRIRVSLPINLGGITFGCTPHDCGVLYSTAPAGWGILGQIESSGRISG